MKMVMSVWVPAPNRWPITLTTEDEDGDECVSARSEQVTLLTHDKKMKIFSGAV